ncbi:exopolyphosphatase/guanosine-5'-triphosphate,3'-diphosphate pyrophosphatase [Sphingomonas vulcanisoli]|uniref:Exopolyphosphatase/guanosine-5'-triphosphate, 3'-diphosphate pyrophosphatase n=1 Tax=Sphingomonas vulcanisoli TaxID=1658060 RepID=A0ABX0TQ29_9SPHN|nr:Ppx/GppA phosphatase family protein [Sphingomonas vulcanisoli]NIJ07636.1 exopolyphosphatase/guanosine-5'-triphosphate,3'-diphosphate pyrophosphatase [Sphingomonas vulcanisoli]
MGERKRQDAARFGAAPAAGNAPAIETKRPRRGDQPRRIYAALDLGTNNCRLLIARPEGDGFVVVDAFSRIVRLGEGLAASGQLSDAAMDRAVAALAICAEKLRRRNVTLVRSVATEACRRAINGQAFIDRVANETGIRLEIITAEQEARLAVTGCQALLEPGDDPALVFDIGGGSTELVLLDGLAREGAVRDWYSAPWGVVSLSESEPHIGGSEAELRAAYARMVTRVADAFAPFAERLRSAGMGPGRLLGTSGTVTTLASLHLDLPAYDRSKVDGLIVPAAAMRAISLRLSGMTVSERAKLACIGRERADLVVAGCAILDVILDLWPAERLGVADRGIREGILRGLIASDAH